MYSYLYFLKMSHIYMVHNKRSLFSQICIYSGLGYGDGIAGFSALLGHNSKIVRPVPSSHSRPEYIVVYMYMLIIAHTTSWLDPPYLAIKPYLTYI